MNRYATQANAWTEWHQGIPAFAGAMLETLYGSLYSSLPQLRLGALDGVNTYLAGANERPQALFLYRPGGHSARVVNEGMQITAADASRFAIQLFARHPEINRITFHAVALDGEPDWPSSVRFTLDEDIVLDLPASEDGYLTSLGKSTRKSLRQRLARAQGLTHCIVPGPEIDAALVDELIGFNHARLTAKQRFSALDRTAARQLLALVRACGMAGVVRIEGRLCGGTLACRFGDDVYSLVNAHDPAFDHLGMGNLSRHLMIVAAIHAGARRFHLLGGNFSSKRGCGARRQPLQHLLLYRSRWRMLADSPHLAALVLRAWRYRIGVALDEGAINPPSAGKPWRLSALFRRLLTGARSIKRHLRGNAATVR